MAFVVFSPLAHAVPIPFELFQESEPRVWQQKIRTESRPEVTMWIHYFTTRKRDRERFDRFMWRGALYKNLIQDILVEKGVPSELYYLAMIESGFTRSAKSSARALGVWQFGAATGRTSGLRIDREVDERLDIVRATRAAAVHLKSLHQQFGNWYLAMAAYNCGIGCVKRAVRRSGSHDFWKLAHGGYLPTETANYVPKFEAAMKITQNPASYGFEEKTYYEFPDLKPVRVTGGKKLQEVAATHGIPLRTLIALNPHLLHAQTPRESRSYKVWLPDERM